MYICILLWIYTQKTFAVVVIDSLLKKLSKITFNSYALNKYSLITDTDTDTGTDTDTDRYTHTNTHTQKCNVYFSIEFVFN